jgi:chromate transporter
MIWSLFCTFFKIGLFTFGGGYSMIPLIEEEIIAKAWCGLCTLVDFIGISESTPGPFAINIATFIGNEIAGVWGAVAATLGVILPSFLIILLVAKFFTKFQCNPWVQSVLGGLRPAVVGLIGAATVLIMSLVFFQAETVWDIRWDALDIKAVGIFAAVFLVSRIFKKAHPILIIFVSMVLGVVCYGFL